MKIIVIVAMTMLVTMPASAAKLYKWVDEDGKVHYSDKVPPDQIRNEHKELSEHGVVKETVEKDLTDEQKVARMEEFKKQRELEAQQQREAAALAAEKNKILMSYSSADQIKRLKQERISALERNIATAKENLVIQEKNHNDLLSRAADKERSGEVVSDVFLEQIKQVKNQIEYQKQYIIDKTNEITATAEKYDGELTKYLMFTGQSES
ncbi:DUF4124 domain-containing protein [Marinicella meishanensis]|uniref:DUF4124 domain-containing protein n=1 Tax=Marinicella meishanensis TaxID=2873263 RepID=UPI001CBFBF0C|nr:DUF4124 domain-containing protein [Marinicella sp. NBU2979]